MPHLNCPAGTVSIRLTGKNLIPNRLGFKELKMGVSSADPFIPKNKLQILPTTLRNKPLKSMPTHSKAPGVFSSCCRYPASSLESHFHRALR